MKANQADYRIATMCRVLEVSRSGYYAWLDREPSARAQANAVLLEKIQEIHKDSDGTYGAPRMHMELSEGDTPASLNRVARVMKQGSIQGVSRRKGVKTTWRSKDAEPAGDLVNRDFTATGPDQLWVADITYIPTWAGFLYLAIVLDVWSRRIVGWAMRTHLRTELVLEALDMALQQRKPDGVIHHSDHGCQYTAWAFGKRCEAAGVRPSMGSVGDAYDNAMAEAFFASLECELLDRRVFRSHAEARMAVFRYIEGWYNPRRRHSALGYLSPMNFETKHRALTDSPPLAAAGLGAHPSPVGTAGLYSAAPQRKPPTPSAEGRDQTTVPQLLPVH